MIDRLIDLSDFCEAIYEFVMIGEINTGILDGFDVCFGLYSNNIGELDAIKDIVSS